MEITPQQLGYLYEDYVEEVLHRRGYSAWSLKKLPENEALRCGLITDQNIERVKRRERKGKASYLDYGVDLVIRDESGYLAGQCKYGPSYAKGITQKDLAGVMQMMHCFEARGWLFAGPTLKMSQAFIEYPVKTLTLEELPMPEDDIKRLAIERGYLERPEETIEVRDYQTKILAQMKTHFKKHSCGVLTMPCRTGKTYLSFRWAQDYGDVVFVAPLRAQVRQGVERFTKTYGGDYDWLLVDSDGGRVPTVKEIKQHLRKARKAKRRVMLAVTYHSVEVVDVILHQLKNPVVIVDEFHNLPGKVIGEWKEDEDGDGGCSLVESDHPLYRFLRCDSVKYLYMSATPKLFELEEVDEDDDPHEELFGTVAGQMPFSEAFGKYICDYRVIVPMIDELKETCVGTLKKQIGIEKLEVSRELLLRTYFLLKAMIDQGVWKTIVYCRSCDDLVEMFELIGQLTDYFGIAVKRFWVDGNVPPKRRKTTFDRFEGCKRRCVFLSVQVLDEGVDFPSCDSVYISHKMGASGRVIQRMSRCLTKHGKKTVGKVLVWAEDGSELRELFSSIREFDPEFKRKIGVASVRMRKRSEKTVDEEAEAVQMSGLMKYVVGMKEWRAERWVEKLAKLQQFIDAHAHRPRHSAVKGSDERTLAKWENGCGGSYTKKSGILKEPAARTLWEAHLKKYEDIYRSGLDAFKHQLAKLEQFIDAHGRRPRQSAVKGSDERTLAIWDSSCAGSYTKKSGILKEPAARTLWEAHLKKYENHYRFGLDAFKHRLAKLEQFIDAHAHRPRRSAVKGSDERTLAQWEHGCAGSYTKKSGILKEPAARTLWEAHLKKYKHVYTGPAVKKQIATIKSRREKKAKS